MLKLNKILKEQKVKFSLKRNKVKSIEQILKIDL